MAQNKWYQSDGFKKIMTVGLLFGLSYAVFNGVIQVPPLFESIPLLNILGSVLSGIIGFTISVVLGLLLAIFGLIALFVDIKNYAKFFAGLIVFFGLLAVGAIEPTPIVEIIGLLGGTLLVQDSTKDKKQETFTL